MSSLSLVFSPLIKIPPVTFYFSNYIGSKEAYDFIMHYVETYIFAPLLLYAVLVFVHYTFRSQAYTVSMVFYEAYGPVISL